MTPDRAARYERVLQTLPVLVDLAAGEDRWRRAAALRDRWRRVLEMWADEIVAARVREALAARVTADVYGGQFASERPAPAECLTPGCICNVSFGSDGEPLIAAIPA
jgi:hypothetical protein